MTGAAAARNYVFKLNARGRRRLAKVWELKDAGQARRAARAVGPLWMTAGREGRSGAQNESEGASPLFGGRERSERARGGDRAAAGKTLWIGGLWRAG